MTEPFTPPAAPPGAPAAPPTQSEPATPLGRAQVVGLRTVLVVVATLAILGVLLGVLWMWWSPPRPIGFVIAPHAVQPDETESFAASDGRFAALTALVGVCAAIVVWFVRSLRGPSAVIALTAGGLLGAWITELVGHALGGGSATGPTQTVVNHLPLQVHMGGLLMIEAAVAVLAYGMFVAFAASDDLDVSRPAALGAVPDGSVGFGGQPQYGWGHGDAPGAVQQPDLAP